MSEESSIQGLNLVQPDLTSEEASPMNTSTTRDLDAELAMWTNVQFPEEPYFSPERDTASRSRHKSVNPSNSSTHDPLSSGLSFFGNVGAAALHERGATDSNHHHERAKSLQIQSLNELFSSWNGGNMDVIFGHPVVDPFLGGMGFSSAPSAEAVDNGLHPLTVREPRDLQARQASQAISTIDPANTSITPPAKKAKVRKAASIDSTFTNINDDSLAEMHYQSAATSSQTSPLGQPTATAAVPSSSQTPSVQEAAISASEDKRRRNTLASARFRLKKKEREAAMEKKAKELDDKVTELERECESLRKENQWLKGLVVGATTGENVFLSGASSGSSANTASGSSNTTASADLEEHIRILKANGYQVTGIPPSTGKRKRNAATEA